MGTNVGTNVGGRTTLVARRHVSLTLDGLQPTHSGRPSGPYTLVPYIAWLAFGSTLVKSTLAGAEDEEDLSCAVVRIKERHNPLRADWARSGHLVREEGKGGEVGL